MHSKQKLLRYGMDQRLIEQFYGSYEEYAGMNRSEWKEIVRKKLIHFACKSKSDFIGLSLVFVLPYLRSETSRIQYDTVYFTQTA